MRDRAWCPIFLPTLLRYPALSLLLISIAAIVPITRNLFKWGSYWLGDSLAAANFDKISQPTPICRSIAGCQLAEI